MEETVQKVELLFGKAESELEALSYKVDLEYKALCEAQQPCAQEPMKLVNSVQSLRRELNQLATEVLDIKKEQQAAMSCIKAQLTTLCSQFDDLSTITGPNALQGDGEPGSNSEVTPERR